MRKPNFLAAQIGDHLRSRFSDVSELEALTEGEESQAFAFKGDGKEMVARINKSRIGFDKDLYARRHFASETLPVPEVIAIEPIESMWICISARARGQTLQAMANEAGRYARTVAATMETIASADVSQVSGFGAFDATGQAPFRHWREYLLAISDPARFDWFAVSRIAPAARVQPLLQKVSACAPTIPDCRKLVHADFGSNNVLAQSGRITAVIDWSEAMLGDPLYDIANIFFWRTWLVCMEEQAAFYERSEKYSGWSAEKLLCYQVRIGLQSAHDAATDGDAGFVDWALTRCESLAAG